MEFVEVMRQWGRLCRQHCAENADDCDGCLLGGTRADVCGSYARDNAEDVEELERLVMLWAEDNPEPVYPTFLEWLISIGVIDQMSTHDVIAATLAMTHIPADMAQKLEIEPKNNFQKPSLKREVVSCIE